jgi:uroporphyrin-III C-methyltransferase / precorrin-2 dehydrogenase / sirohydrochlorin ferrochelatase
VPPYLLGLRLSGRRVAVIGGGRVAQRRVPTMLAAGADVLLVAPQVTPMLEDLSARGELTWERRPYRTGDCDGAWLVQACTDDAKINAMVAAEAEANHVWCVRADDAEASAAWTPASGRVGGTGVGVLTDADPRRAARLRDAIVAGIRDGTLQDPRASDTTPVPRASDTTLVPPASGTTGTTIPSRSEWAAITHQDPSPGAVALVGGGPGDPGLITVRGRQLLALADVVITDRLAPRELLDELPDTVEIVDAAKIPYGRSVTQEHINTALVEHARAGRLVVRLKGGDPFVFGRGAEEVLHCAREGIPVTVVPGVTSATAVPAVAGVPVTHRGLTQEFHVVSAHIAPGQEGSTVDWQALARGTGTLVLLMAVERLGAIAETLMRYGRSPDTPAAVIQDGTLQSQCTLMATLRTLADETTATGVRPPAIVIVGDVVRVAREIDMLKATRPTHTGRTP